MAATLTASFGDPIKQYPGLVQVERRVKVDVPGKHFNGLTDAEATQSFSPALPSSTASGTPSSHECI